MGISSGFSDGSILLPAPRKCGKNGKDFYFKDSSWNSQHFPFQLLFTILHNNWFQSCYSVSGRGGCNWNVAGVNYRDLKYWAVSSRVSLSYLLPVLTLALLLFLPNSSSSLTVFILLLPHLLSSGPWRSHWSVSISAVTLRFYPLKALQQTTLFIFYSFFNILK